MNLSNREFLQEAGPVALASLSRVSQLIRAVRRTTEVSGQGPLEASARD